MVGIITRSNKRSHKKLTSGLYAGGRRSSIPAPADFTSDPAFEALLKWVVSAAVDEFSSRRGREDMIPGVRVVSERELPKYTPWNAKKVRAMREEGLIKPVNADASGKCKGDPLYNLYDVWAAINQNTPGRGQGVRRIPLDLEVKLS